MIKILICECGEVIEGSTFRDYIKTSAGPSTLTIGHEKCGYIFNFIDDKMSKRYSSKKNLKILACRFAERNILDNETRKKFLIEIDRLKSNTNLSDQDILMKAFEKAMISQLRNGDSRD